MNCTQQIGRVTADIEPVRLTDRGAVTSFRVAVPRPRGSAKDADFFTVEVWRRLAEVCAEQLSRGREVAVDGRLEQRQWLTADGDARERVVIVARSVRFLSRGRHADAVAPAPPEADVDSGHALVHDA